MLANFIFYKTDSGIVPTKWQRRFLVITRLYRRQSEIPNFVRNGTMNRMHDRMRVVFIVVAVCFFYVVSFFCESNLAEKITRDRAAGVRV
ncbi:unnamed protein product [Heligmosomoides polygyrus]|uniref:Transmembrane protein n=1 Tax=Heligmosomoides polygyrus TaxID=6339 RepID=A0A183FV97_HELPZ|nr:unnamed protein product [Heligmosomoides polygyrus]